LLDLACGDGFYTRRFRTECGANPVIGIDLSPKQIERAEAIEGREQLGIEYRVGDVLSLNFDKQFEVVTAIHLLHYLQSATEIELALRWISQSLCDGGHFVTMIATL
jgi:toxoflavin synthase